MKSSEGKVYIYGAGQRGMACYSFIRKRINEEICFVDKSLRKQGEGYCGCRVLSPRTFIERIDAAYEAFSVIKLIIAMKDVEAVKEVQKLVERYSKNGRLLISDSEEEVRRIQIKDRAELKINDFSIISNNCWGGAVYRHFDLPYLSPTVGLFFLSDDYLKFVSKLKEYMSKELVFINPSEAHRRNECSYIGNFGEYPIGRLGDIDIHFLHYKTQEEAFEKWCRRANRINWDRLIIKDSTQNLWTECEMRRFSQLPYMNKILFTSRRIAEIEDQYVFEEKGRDTTDEGIRYPMYIDILSYLNNRK